MYIVMELWLWLFEVMDLIGDIFEICGPGDRFKTIMIS